ncbi:MAG: hypothetical protein IPM25_07145 [Chloracidobacterium sp.]|nr:hypothetical protein [Chloracidobacterium sp.]
MTLDDLVDATSKDLIRRISRSAALGVFAKRRAKFEGWLKVELVDILISKGYDAIPEQGLIDVTFRDVAIELKTVNTNYRDGIAENTIRPITMNINAVVHDINNLRLNPVETKFVIFIVFPSIDNDRWRRHLQRVNDALGRACCGKHFRFKSGVAGTIYYGQVA